MPFNFNPIVSIIRSYRFKLFLALKLAADDALYFLLCLGYGLCLGYIWLTLFLGQPGAEFVTMFMAIIFNILRLPLQCLHYISLYGFNAIAESFKSIFGAAFAFIVGQISLFVELQQALDKVKLLQQNLALFETPWPVALQMLEMLLKDGVLVYQVFHLNLFFKLNILGPICLVIARCIDSSPRLYNIGQWVLKQRDLEKAQLELAQLKLQFLASWPEGFYNALVWSGVPLDAFIFVLLAALMLLLVLLARVAVFYCLRLLR